MRVRDIARLRRGQAELHATPLRAAEGIPFIRVRLDTDAPEGR